MHDSMRSKKEKELLDHVIEMWKQTESYNCTAQTFYSKVL